MVRILTKDVADPMHPYTVVEVDMRRPRGCKVWPELCPEGLSELEPPRVGSDRGVVLSGAGPVWLFLALGHEYASTKWVAIYDPVVGGAIVTQRHALDAPKLGEVLPVNLV